MLVGGRIERFGVPGTRLLEVLVFSVVTEQPASLTVILEDVS